MPVGSDSLSDRLADSLSVREDMARRFRSDTFLAGAVRAAVRAAVRDHKQAGNPVVGWQDGRLVVVAPEDIQVPGDEATDSAAA